MLLACFFNVCLLVSLFEVVKMLVENVVLCYFMVVKDGKSKLLVTSLIKKKNIIAQTMIHFLCCFQCSLGHWFMNVPKYNYRFQSNLCFI